MSFKKSHSLLHSKIEFQSLLRVFTFVLLMKNNENQLFGHCVVFDFLSDTDHRAQCTHKYRLIPSWNAQYYAL